MSDESGIEHFELNEAEKKHASYYYGKRIGPLSGSTSNSQAQQGRHSSNYQGIFDNCT